MPPCPWSSFTPASYVYCETQRCGWIIEPANAWTNVGYLLVALWLLRTRARPWIIDDHLAFWPSLALAFGSFAFHATGTEVGRYLDVGAMLALSTGTMVLALRSALHLPARRTPLLYLVVLASSLVYLAIADIGTPLFAAELAITAAVEAWSHRRGTTGRDPAELWRSSGCLLLALAFQILDRRKILCAPDNHLLSGHGVWHLLAAAAMFFFFRFQRSQSVPGHASL